jgi:hypothetical protein
VFVDHPLYYFVGDHNTGRAGSGWDALARMAVLLSFIVFGPVVRRHRKIGAGHE